MRALQALGRLDEATAAGVRGFLGRVSPAALVETTSWLSAAAECAMGAPNRAWGEGLEAFRTPDGGYGRQAGSAAGSVSQAFLAVLSYEMLGLTVPHVDRLRAFMKAQRRPDGGFADLPALKHSSTNATAAGTAVALLLGDSPTALGGVAEFLHGLRRLDGWPAAARSPMSDLLTTFTAALTLHSLSGFAAEDAEALRVLLRLTERAEGGFGAAAGDPGTDVEYTYYGLGCTALVGLFEQVGAPR